MISDKQAFIKFYLESYSCTRKDRDQEFCLFHLANSSKSFMDYSPDSPIHLFAFFFMMILYPSPSLSMHVLQPSICSLLNSTLFFVFSLEIGF